MKGLLFRLASHLSRFVLHFNINAGFRCLIIMIILSLLYQKPHEFKSTPVRDITIYCPKFLYKLCFVTAFDDVKYLQMCRTFPNTVYPL